MNKKQWNVLGTILILFTLWIVFIDYNTDCIEDSFSNFADTSSLSSDYAYNEYNLIQCAVEIKMYDIYFNLAWFLAIICFIMGWLEPSEKKKKS